MIDHLLLILMLHQGRDKATSAESLMQALRTYGDEVRDLPALRGIVHAARKRGHLIASCQAGYFIPISLEESMKYIHDKLSVPSMDLLQTRRIQLHRAVELFGRQPRMI